MAPKMLHNLEAASLSRVTFQHSFVCLSSYCEPLSLKSSVAFLNESNLSTLVLYMLVLHPKMPFFTLFTFCPSSDPHPWIPCSSLPVWARGCLFKSHWHPVHFCHDVILAWLHICFPSRLRILGGRVHLIFVSLIKHNPRHRWAMKMLTWNKIGCQLAACNKNPRC